MTPVTVQVNGAVKLTWDASTTNPAVPVTAYLILRSTTSGGENGTPIATVTAPTGGTVVPTTYTDSTGAPGTSYWYEVVAQNSVGNSGASNELGVLFLATQTVPSKPTSLGGSQG
jgi:hypothetical protein